MKHTIFKTVVCLLLFNHLASKLGAADIVMGVDLSMYNQLFNANAVKAQSYGFAYCETNKWLRPDSAFKTNWTQARTAGLPCGAFVYLIPGKDLDAQVELFISTVRAVNNQVNKELNRHETLMLPPGVDIENAKDWLRRMPNPKQRLDAVLACLRKIENKLGVRPIVYLSPSFVQEALGGGSPELARYGLWVAQYKVAAPRVPKPWTRWHFWQMKNNGEVAGISGRHDRDIDCFNGPISQLRKLLVSL